MTSYHRELIQLMSTIPIKSNNSHGAVLPSSVHPVLKPLDRFSGPSHVLVGPLIQLFLATLIWSGFALAFSVYFCFSTYHLALDAVLFVLTAWRIEMLTAAQPGARTPRREFASSKAVSMDDVRTCQKAFSGRGRKQHVTVNDVMCAVMSDVLGEEIRSKAPEKTVRGRVNRMLNKILPSPIAFFM